MGTLADQKRRRKKARKQSPFGAEISRLLSGRSDVRTVLSGAIGRELADRWIRGARSAKWRTCDRNGVERRDHDLADDCPTVARYCAMLLIILGETRDPKRKRVCSKRLYRGRTHTAPFVDGDGVIRRAYIPAGHTGGLAGRLGCSVKTVERMAQVAQHRGLLSTWQAPKHLGEEYRGREWGYSMWQWALELPRIVVQRLQAWWQPSTAPKAPGPPTAPPDRPPLSPAAQAMADAILARYGPG